MKLPKYITRDFIQQHQDVIFVFGDNLQRQGYGGQAAVCRGEINAWGVPTKVSPDNKDDSFFSDEMFDTYKSVIDLAISEIPRDGRQIYVMPNIGAGLAEMPQRCPKLYQYLVAELKKL